MFVVVAHVPAACGRCLPWRASFLEYCTTNDLASLAHHLVAERRLRGLSSRPSDHLDPSLFEVLSEW